jgi:hypothetical protein
MYGFFPFQFPNTLSANVSSRGGKREAAKADGEIGKPTFHLVSMQ